MHDRAAQCRTEGGPERREFREYGRERGECVAVDEEIVSHRQQHVHVAVERKPRQEFGERGLS